MKRTRNIARPAPAHDNVLRKCADCGRNVVGSRKVYHYTECGLSNIKLRDILVFECECGSVMPEIPAIEELHHHLAVTILQKKTLLSGEEVRFLRKMAGLTQAQLAEIMGVHKTRPCKWESEEEPIGKENDRVLRSCGLFGMLQQALNSEDPIAATTAATAVIRSLDVRKIFRELENKRPAKSRDQFFENMPTAESPDLRWRTEGLRPN